MSLTEHDSRFKEHMGGFFHDFLRAAGITMTPGNSMARIRSIGERMASAIEHAAERKSIQVIKKLQKAVSKGFVDLETELNKVKTSNAELVLLIGKHNKLIERNFEVLEKLQAKVEKLEADEVQRNVDAIERATGRPYKPADQDGA